MSNVICPDSGSPCQSTHHCGLLGCQRITIRTRVMAPPNVFPLPSQSMAALAEGRDVELATLQAKLDRAVELLKFGQDIYYFHDQEAFKQDARAFLAEINAQRLLHEKEKNDD